jgi:predicted DNA-binding transcriptional regulator YafY
MSKNKNAILRYNILDKCFRNPGKRYFMEDLLKEINKTLLENGGEEVKRRQVFDDMTFMESDAGWSAPLDRIKDGRKTFYRYNDLSFSISNQPLNEEQINHIESALATLSSIKGLPQFGELQEVLTTIKNGKTSPDQLSAIMEFSANEYVHGREHLGPLFNAIHYRKVLKIAYQSFKQEMANELQFHPYLLKQYNNRWFLLGLNERLGKISTLALDRIKSIVEFAMSQPPSEFNADEYFEDMIGVTRQEGQEPLEVILRFAQEEAPYILTKPIHGSQRKISDDESGLVIALEVIHNPELERLILSFGSKVEVVAPATLRTAIESNLSRAIELYS